MITIPDFAPRGKDPRTLVASVGNTNTRFGWFQGADLVRTEAVPTPEIVAAVPALPADCRVALVSVVPEATRALVAAWGDRVRVLDADSSGLRISYDPPESMGADRLANALALRDRHLVPGIAVDCGTATTLTVVDAQGGVVGGAIAPGLGTAARALVGNTAQLRAVLMVSPAAAWGSDTLTCLQLGMVTGHAGMIRALVERIRQGLGMDAPVVLCGGWAETMAEILPDYECAPFLTLEGARVFVSGDGGGA